jgi:hypothetical protein
MIQDRIQDQILKSYTVLVFIIEARFCTTRTTARWAVPYFWVNTVTHPWAHPTVWCKLKIDLIKFPVGVFDCKTSQPLYHPRNSVSIAGLNPPGGYSTSADWAREIFIRCPGSQICASWNLWVESMQVTWLHEKYQCQGCATGQGILQKSDHRKLQAYGLSF